jgi:hypothetical protein
VRADETARACDQKMRGRHHTRHGARPVSQS